MVGAPNASAHGIDCVSLSPLPRGTPHCGASFRVLQKLLDLPSCCLLVLGSNEQRDPLPQFTERRNVGQNKHTTLLSGFQDGKAKRFIVRHREKDRLSAQMPEDL